MSKRAILTSLASAAFTLIPAAMAVACPMCGDSIPSSDAAQAGSLPGGFNVSVYLMLVGFLSMVGFTVGIITKGIYSTNAQMKQRGFPLDDIDKPGPQ